MSFFDGILDFASDIGGDLLGFGGDIVGGLGDFGSSALELFGDDDIWGSISGLAGSILPEALSVYSTLEASEAALRAGESAAEVYFKNAELLEREAGNVMRRTNDNLIVQRHAGIKFMAEQASRYLKSGVTLEGSPLLVMQETADFIEFDILRAYETGEDTAKQLKERANIEVQKGQAAIDEASFQAEATAIEGAVGAAKRIFDF